MMNISNQNTEQPFEVVRNNKLGVSQQIKKHYQLDNAYENFVETLFDKQDYKWALMLTLKQSYEIKTDKGTYYKSLTFDDCRQIGERFLARLSRRTYKHAYGRYRKKVKALWAIENKSNKGNFHLHFAIGRLTSDLRKQENFNKALLNIKEHITEINNYTHLQEIYSRKYNGYLTKELRYHNFDNLYFYN